MRGMVTSMKKMCTPDCLKSVIFTKGFDEAMKPANIGTMCAGTCWPSLKTGMIKVLKLMTGPTCKAMMGGGDGSSSSTSSTAPNTEEMEKMFGLLCSKKHERQVLHGNFTTSTKGFRR